MTTTSGAEDAAREAAYADYLADTDYPGTFGDFLVSRQETAYWGDFLLTRDELCVICGEPREPGRRTCDGTRCIADDADPTY